MTTKLSCGAVLKDPDQTSLPSLPSAVNLSLAPLVHTEELPSEFLSFVSIPLLNSRIPPNALKNLTTSFPVIKFLRYFSRARKLDAATAASLLANCTPFIAPRLRDLKWDDAKGYLFFLGTCFKALPISYFSKPANSTAMDIDEPSSTVDSSQMLDRLLSTAHLSAVLAMSRSSSASRPALAEFTCSLLPLLSARQTEDFLTVLAFSPSAGSGLVRELFRIVRTDPVFKLGASKEQWKDVVRCLTDRQNVEGWSILLLLVLVYTRMLRSMGDDAFYPSNNFANSSSTSSSSNASTEQNPLQLEEVRSLAELVRNIAFALYWQPPDRARIGRMNVEGVRDTFRKLASALHEREYVSAYRSRRLAFGSFRLFLSQLSSDFLAARLVHYDRSWRFRCPEFHRDGIVSVLVCSATCVLKSLCVNLTGRKTRG